MRKFVQILSLFCLLPGVAQAEETDHCRPDSRAGRAWTTRTGCQEVPLEHGNAEAGTLEIYYELSIPELESQGAIIVFHGGPAYPRKHLHESGWLWESLRTHFTLLYFHQRGAGYSGRVVTKDELKGKEHLYTLEAIVRDSVILHKALLGPEKAILFGKSAGGFIALLYGLDYPELVSGLIVAATSPYHGYISSRDKVKAAFFREMNRRYPGFVANTRRSFEVLEPGPFAAFPPLKDLFITGDVIEPILLDLSYTLTGQFEIIALTRDVAHRRFSLLLERVKAGRKTLRITGLESVAVLNLITCREFNYAKSNPAACGAIETTTLYDVRPRLKELKVPVLVLSGQYDPILPPSFQEEIVKYLETKHEWHVLEMSAHMLFQEQPMACVRLILDFLNVPRQQMPQSPAL